MKKIISHKKSAGILSLLLGGCLYGSTVFAANLVATVPSDYSNSQMGAVTGSRVTTNVDVTPVKAAADNLNRDPAVFNININGQSMIFLRQYTYSTTDLKGNSIIDAEGNWRQPTQSGVISDVANAHGVTANDKYVFATGYDMGKIGVAKIVGSELQEDRNKTIDLRSELADKCGAACDEKDGVHGEGICVNGNNLYVLVSVNPGGGFDTYLDGFLMQYSISSDGKLTFQNYTRVGKNTDSARLNFYNNKVFVSSIGGMQNYGSGNADTAIHVADIYGNQLKENSYKIKVPSNVQCDFRDMKILPNGTAYIMTYTLAGGGGGVNLHVYKTNVSNLMSDSPKNWEEVINKQEANGWFGKLNAEYYTKRLWAEIGNTLNVYTDGSTTPIVWEAKDFGSNEQYYQFNSVAMLRPDSVTGETAKLTIATPEGLTSPSVTVEKVVNENATMLKGDYTDGITGTGSDTQYSDVTGDDSKYIFNADKVISLGVSKAGGDLDTNVLAAIYARNGNDISVDSTGNTLQLQAKNYIGTPVGIYAGNGKNVTVTAGKLNIITAGYEEGNTLTNAIWNDAGKTDSSVITINAPVNISMSGGYGGNGIAIEKTDRWGEASNAANVESKIIINGDVSIKGEDNEQWGIPINSENVYSRFNNAGILTSVDKSSVTINGNVDFSVYGNGAATNAKDSKITISGGSIKVPTGTNYGYYTLASYQGTINMNTGSDGATPGTSAVKLDGDIFALSTGTVNLGLTTADSYLNGIADNGGTVNMWLQNGATWSNVANNTRYKEDNEDIGNNGLSRISQLTGGNNAANAGVIAQKADSKDLAIDKYSGYTTVLYNHDATTPSNILGGKIKIGSAVAGSNITLRTDYDNNMSTEEVQKNVLNALANKLYYSAYTTNEVNLSGKVEIAEGLTTQAASKYVGDIVFDKSNGQGSLNNGITPTPGQTVTDFTSSITGGTDKPYVDGGVKQTDGSYLFTKDSKITLTSGNVIQPGYNSTININAAGKVLTADVNGSKLLTGIYNTSSNGNVNITADKTIFNINNDNKEYIQKAYGIWMNSDGGKVTISGLTEINTNAADLSYGINASYGSIQLDGLHVTVNKDAVDADSLYIDGNSKVAVNVKDGSTGTNEVKIDGDIFSSSKISDNGYTASKNSTVDLALTTGSSYFNGLSSYTYSQDNDDDSTTTVSHGTVNMWLQNGATWINKKYGNADYDSGFSGSALTKLIGGADTASAGTIFQKDNKDIKIDNYSGYTTVLFTHDSVTPTTINGGNVKIGSASVGSSIALRTDYDANMSTSTIQNNVLNALANKLYYTAYTTGERNLSGKVEIAEGLTAQAASKYVGDVAFDKDSGQGKYGSDEPQPPAEQTTTAFTTSLTGVKDTDAAYVNGGVLKDGAYAFTKDSTITVDDKNVSSDNIGYYKAVAAIIGNSNDIVINSVGKTLGLAASTTDANNQAIGIYTDKKLTMTTSGLTITSTSAGKTASGIFVSGGGAATINGNVNISAQDSAAGNAYGVYAYNNGSKLIINGNLTMKGSGDGDAAYGVSVAEKGGYGTPAYQASGIYIYDNTIGSEVTVTGKADIVVKGTGVDMRGNKNNKVTIASGNIITPESEEDKFNALNIAAGTFSMGMNNAVTDASGADVTIKGNIYTLADGKINLGLGSANSLLTGVIENADGGSVNIYLENGAIWNNLSTSKALGFTGSHISNLVGGTAYGKGVIFQKDSNPLSIDNYSGYTTVLYSHDASTPTTIIGGDVKIGTAATGSNITLRTDNTGLNTSSTLAVDKNLVSATLNALANKLYYTAYTTNERNLTGKVEIAEGLTAQSASMEVGDITYKTDNGQGQYEYTPAEDVPDTSAITNSTTLQKSRVATATEANAEAGKYVSALYSENTTSKAEPMIIDMNGQDLTLVAASTSKIASGIFAGTNQYITIKNDTKDKTLNISATNTDTRGSSGIKADGNAHLTISGPVSIDGVSTKGDSVSGIQIQGQDSEIIVNGPLAIKNITAVRERGNGINAAGIMVTGENSKVTVNDTVDIAGVRGSSLVTIGANTSISVQGGTITSAVDVDHSKKFYAARVEKGIINVNMNGDTAGSTTTKVTGDVYVTREYGKKVVEYSGGTLIDFDNKGILNLALMNNQSYWTGVAGYAVDNSDYGTGGFTAHDIGTFNLYLQNGATWSNEQQSSVSTTFAGSKVTKLTGGSDISHAGFIFQKDSNPLSIDNYSGYTTVLYSHDASTPTTIIGGDVKIGTAATGSNITLRTDNTGLNTSSTLAVDKNLVSATLNALANKLYYTAYTTNERNLTGKVEIAEGLTAQSASMQVGDITYKTDNGQGQYEYTPAIDIPDSQDKTEFATAINGNAAIDTEYVNAGVRKDNGQYIFTKDTTTLTPAKNLIAAGAWMPKISSAISGSTADTSVSIDLNNKNLIINTTTDTHTTGITAIGDGKVEVNNAGKITINTESTKGGQTAALYTNGGGHIIIHNGGDNLDSKVLTLRADTTNKANGAVIKSMNGVGGKESSVIIDGLVDVLADGDTSDGKGANEAVSAVASTIEIGGGSIKATNGAWCAIRAYGEFVSDNYGTVNVNIAKDNDGKVIGAGKNKTVIEGDFVTNGGMGTKGRISVGLSTADSYWKGNYTDVTGYGVTQGQLGNVNLFMSNGSNWTGYTKGTMTVSMASGATWNGYNTGENFSLNLSDNAVWYNTNLSEDSSNIKYFNGSSGTAKTGYIDMTTTGVGNLVIDNYSGNTTVLYKHDTTTPTTIIGGDTTIKHAEAASSITLRTDSSGIDMQDDIVVGSVLGALANKLYYTNYTTDERNLSGYVQIAEGLTTSSVTKQTGNITFDGTTGKGTLDKATVTPGVKYPDSQTTDSFTTAINSDWTLDKEYKQAGVLKTDGSFIFNKDKTVITTGKNLISGGPYLPQISSAVSGSSADKSVKMDLNNKELAINTVSDTHTTGITAINDGKVEINNAGKIAVTAESTGSGQTAALFVNGGGQIVIHNGGNDSENKVLTARAASTSKNNGAVIKAMNGADGKRSSIIVDGLVDVLADGDMTDGKGANEAISSVASDISVGGGSIRAINGAAYAIRAYGEFVSANTGSVNVNVSKDSNGNVIGAGSNKTVIEGDFSTQGGMGTNGLINVGLGTADSSWTGNYTTNGGNVNLYMKDGATWTGYNTGENFTLDMKNNAKWIVTGDSTISTLTSGESFIKALAANKIATTTTSVGGIVDMTNDKAGNVTIDNYSGSTTFIYKHDEKTPTTILGGNTTIKHAAVNSIITLRTDRSGFDLSNSTLVDSVLSALAGKLNYTNYATGENNLSGYVQIAEGLTASSAGRSTGTIEYNATDGTALLKPGSVITSGSDVIYGSKETAMMRGAKSAMASAAMLWRSESSDLMQRMGDLRLGSEENGLWAKYYTGKSEYNMQNTYFSNSYTTYQLGFDKKVANNWTVGAAVSYNDGSSSYDLSGRGDNSATSLSLYGTWQGEKGHYLDLLLKGSSIRNDYTVYNDFGHKLKGNYKTWGTSLSAEYGRNIQSANGIYFDPSIMLTLGRIQGSDYSAASDFLDSKGSAKDMAVSQDGFNSAIGRISIGIGQKTKTRTLFAKLALAHEFAGNFATNYAADGEPTGNTEIKFGDTWCEMQLGGSVKLNNNSYVYATYGKTFNADLTNKWRVDAGVRWTF